MKKKIISISLVLIGLMIFSCRNNYKPQVTSNIDPIYKYMDSLRTAMIGKEFYNLVFTDSANNKFDLKSYKGNIVAINIWVSGCKPCMDEIPKLNVIVDRNKNKPVKFISIIRDGGYINFIDTTFKKYYKTKDFKYLTVGTDKHLNKLYNFQEIFPQHIILDKKGIVIDYFFGNQTNRLDSIINSNK